MRRQMKLPIAVQLPVAKPLVALLLPVALLPVALPLVLPLVVKPWPVQQSPTDCCQFDMSGSDRGTVLLSDLHL